MLPLLRSFLSQPLMLDGQTAASLRSMVEADSAIKPTPSLMSWKAPCPIAMATEQISAAKPAAKGTRMTAVLPVFGMITQHSSFWNELFGGTSLDSLSRAFDMVMNEPKITDIVFQFHTPGGEIFGVKEFADKVYSARKLKPMCSVVDSQMSSAGYYIGSATDRVYVTPFGQLGSIGVILVWPDETEAMAKAGVKMNVRRIPATKADINYFESPSDSALEHIDSKLSDLYETFTKDVARHRDRDQDDVKKKFGAGREVNAATAIETGMADRIATFEQVLVWSASGTLARSIAQGPRAIEEDHHVSMIDGDAIAKLRRRFAIGK